jgi:hypothetical protein
MSRSIVTFPDSVFAEAWLDFQSRVGVISEEIYVTPAQRLRVEIATAFASVPGDSR